jgi:hypothetical protein
VERIRIYQQLLQQMLHHTPQQEADAGVGIAADADAAIKRVGALELFQLPQFRLGFWHYSAILKAARRPSEACETWVNHLSALFADGVDTIALLIIIIIALLIIALLIILYIELFYI